MINMASKRRQDVILEDEFSVYPRSKLFTVTLTGGGIFHRAGAGAGKSVSCGDIVGCHCYRGRTASDRAAYFTVFGYPFRRKFLSGKRARHRVTVTFRVCKSAEFRENLETAERWRRVIVLLARGKSFSSVHDVENSQPLQVQKMLILVNPFSGPGKALKIFQQQVAPMLAEADIAYEMVVTGHAGHASEIVMKMDIYEWYGIVIVSGDGLVYEVINGLMSRSDWDKAVKIPIGCIPGGSGNALCSSVNYLAGEPILENFILHSTFVLIKHQVLAWDLVAIQTARQNLFSFMSMTWGFIADVDYESEKYRSSLGSSRFLLLTAQRLLGLRTYHGRLSFLPIAEFRNQKKDEVKALRRLRRFSLTSASPSSSQQGSKCTINSDGANDCVWEATNKQNKAHSVSFHNMDEKNKSQNNLRNGFKKSRCCSETNLMQKDSKSDLDFDDWNSFNCLQTPESVFNEEFIDGAYSTHMQDDICGNVQSSTLSGRTITTANNVIYKEEVLTVKKHSGAPVPTPLLPPVDKPVPDNWIVIDDHFITVFVVYQTHLSTDFLAAPGSRFNDGFIHLHFTRAGISRNALLGLLRNLENGSFMDSPYVESAKVLAFRLEPLDEQGNIMLDGEHLENETIQGQIIPSVARIMAIR